MCIIEYSVIILIAQFISVYNSVHLNIHIFAKAVKY